MAEYFNNIFPHPTLTIFSTTTPSQATLRILHQELNANAIAIPSARGNGALGHFALVTSAANYLTLALVPFLAPDHPGVAPIHAANATGAQITEVNRQFAVDVKEHTLYNNTEAALKKQLLQAVPATFTQKLCHPELGYANVSTLDILTHLDTTYGKVNEDDLDRNLTELHRPWQVSSPIETLFIQLDNCRVFAEATDPISEATAVRAGLLNLENTACFTDAIREWRNKPTADRTLANFETHFAKADIERKRTLTTKGAGYHQAANVRISEEVPTTNNTANNAVTDAGTTPTNKKYFYCWSHGLSTNAKHTSLTCKNQAPGHQKHAIISNMKGGCNIIQRRRGEQQVFVRPPRPEQTENNE